METVWKNKLLSRFSMCLCVVLVLTWKRVVVSRLKEGDLSQRACKPQVTGVNQASVGEFVLQGHPQLGNCVGNTRQN